MHQDKTKIYKLDKLKEMLFNDDKALDMMIKRFINTTNSSLEELNKALNEGNYRLAKRLLYNINLSLNILGIEEIHKDLQYIELIEKEILYKDELKKLINKTKNICNKLFNQLSNYKN